MDDILVVFNLEKSGIIDFILHLNDKCKSILLIFELEQNRKLPFLYVLVLKPINNKLEFIFLEGILAHCDICLIILFLVCNIKWRVSSSMYYIS